MLLQRGCTFCDIVSGEAPADIVRRWPGIALALVPLRPVVPGHRLIIPMTHVADAADHSGITGDVATCAAEMAAGLRFPFNLITSAGAAATQTVFHLHWHYVPRREGDGLALPWSAQR